MNKAVIYVHGQGGNAEEAKHYEGIFENCRVVGLDYESEYPWEAVEEFPAKFDEAADDCESVVLIANSIGAYFSMCALADKKIEKAFFISPIVNMEKLITDMLAWADVSEDELEEAGEIQTSFGQTLSWEYLSYVRKNPIKWEIPTHVLYGENDQISSLATIQQFADQIGATLTVMENGEHWFHTEEQMSFLDEWIKGFK